MLRKLAPVFLTVFIGSLVLAPSALAHNVFASPRFAPLGRDFVFVGTLWQPNRTVRVFYDERNDGDFDRTGTFTSRSNGSFRFRWSGEDIPTTHRMCFRQFDSRRSFRRTFFKCARFTATTEDFD